MENKQTSRDGWLCAYTAQRGEFLMVHDAEKLGRDIYCPWFFRTIRHARKVQTVRRPLFPRYVFVKVNEDGWSWIRDIRGFERLIGGANAPWRVPASFLSYLRQCEDAEGQIHSLQPNLAPGEDVFVTEGPFRGMSAKVVRIPDAQRVQILISMFGREHTVDVAGIYLQKQS